jgi:hypothetical protein
MQKHAETLASAAYINYAGDTEYTPGIIVLTNQVTVTTSPEGKIEYSAEAFDEQLRSNYEHEKEHVWAATLRAAKEDAAAEHIYEMVVRSNSGRRTLYPIVEAEQPELFSPENIIAKARELNPEKYANLESLDTLSSRELKTIKDSLVPQEYCDALFSKVSGEAVAADLNPVLEKINTHLEHNGFQQRLYINLAEEHLKIKEHRYDRKLEEFVASTRNISGTIKLGDVTAETYNATDREFAALVGLMRITNNIQSATNETESIIKADNDRTWLASYLGYLGDETGSADAPKIMKKISEALAITDEANAPADLLKLKEIIGTYCPELVTPITEIDSEANSLADTLLNFADGFVADYNNKEVNGLATGLFGENGAVATASLLADPALKAELSGIFAEVMRSQNDPARLEEMQELLSRANALILEKTQNQELANLFRQFLTDPNLIRNPHLIRTFMTPPVAGGEYDELGIPRDAVEDTEIARFVHASPYIRHPARIAVNNFFFGDRKKGTFMGNSFGGKLDIFTRYRHPKSPSIPFLKFLGFDTKVAIDGFGIGFGKNEIRLDAQDFREAVAFTIGLPIHKMASLERLFLDKNVEMWKPAGFLKANVDAYSAGVTMNIYKRLNAEHSYDPQSMARLVQEFGGWDYDASGQPIPKRSTYATRVDDYRLNPVLADFLVNTLATGDNSGRTDIVAIAERMREDSLYVDGVRTQVIFQNGNIVRKDNPSVIVQEGGVKIGQITGNTVKEIEEIMVYYENYDANKRVPKPLNPLGQKMTMYLDQFKKPTEKVGMLKKFKALAEVMMIEDSQRRKKHGSYTMYDLINEMERVQALPFPENLYDEHGERIAAAFQKFENPQISIGNLKDENGKAITYDLLTAKEFFKEFSLARAEKILTTGVWGKEHDYAVEEDPVSHKKSRVILGQEEWQMLVTDLSDKDHPKYKPGFKHLDIEDEDGNYFQFNDEIYFSPKPKYGDSQARFIKVNSTEKKYTTDAKLKFVSKQTGYEFQLDAIQGLNPDVLKRYFGTKKSFKVRTFNEKTGVMTEVDVNGRENYQTDNGVIFDDIYDELTKTNQGKEISYNYSVKLGQIDKYRDFSKLHKELWAGIKMLDDNFRNAVIAATILSMLVPGLAFLANPTLLLATIAWSATMSPMIVRWGAGWATREKASLEALANVMSMRNEFWSLADDNNPPSFGQIDLARSMFETVKFQYKGMCKSMNDGAKWNTNIFTNLLAMGFEKVSAKPF